MGPGLDFTALGSVYTAGVRPYNSRGELRSHAACSWGGKAKLKASW